MNLFKKKSDAPDTSVEETARTRKVKQWVIILAILTAAYLVFFLLLASVPKKKVKHQKDEVTSTNVLTPGAQIEPRDAWIGGAGQSVAEQGTRLNQQEQTSKTLVDRINLLEQELKKKAAASSGNENKKAETTEAAFPPIVPNKSERAAAAFPPSTPGQIGAGSPVNLPPGVTLPPMPNSNAPRALSGNAIAARAPDASIGHFTLADKPVFGAPKALEQNAGTGLGSSKKRGAGQTFLPVGFMKVTLIGGIDAPTSGQAQNNPLPVVLHVDDLAVLPNRYRANVKDCLVVGAAYGDLPAERAYIRLETLSCIRHDKRVLETKIQGVVYGEDGKLGIRGRLVSKQGQMLANALMAGVVGGIGQGFQTQNTQSTVTGFGSVVQTPNAGHGFEAGLSGGVGKALDRLANYYISLAEKTYPVIEVDSMRHVDAAITKGAELDVPLPSDVEKEDEDEDE